MGLRSEYETLKFEYEIKLRSLTEETQTFRQEAVKREMDIEIYINELYSRLKVKITRTNYYKTSIQTF